MNKKDKKYHYNYFIKVIFKISVLIDLVTPLVTMVMVSAV